MYNASQRGRNHPSFDQRSPANHAFVTRSHLGKRNQRQHHRDRSSQTTARFRVALRRCPPCYFKLVATRPATQWKCVPRTHSAPNGSRRLFRRTLGLSLQDHAGTYRTCAVETTDEAHVAAVPTFIVFLACQSPSNFTGHSMVPRIFSLPLTCPGPRKSPQFPCHASGNSR